MYEVVCECHAHQPSGREGGPSLGPSWFEDVDGDVMVALQKVIGPKTVQLLVKDTFDYGLWRESDNLERQERFVAVYATQAQ